MTVSLERMMMTLWPWNPESPKVSRGRLGQRRFLGLSLVASVEPELRSVFIFEDVCGGGGGVFYPAFGEDALAVPDAVEHAEKSEAGHVARGGVGEG